MKQLVLCTALLTACHGTNRAAVAETQPPPIYDIVVYGGTSAGVIAAVQAARMGKSVIVVCPEKHLGGLSSGGLGFTDTGMRKSAPRKPSAWKVKPRSYFTSTPRARRARMCVSSRRRPITSRTPATWERSSVRRRSRGQARSSGPGTESPPEGRPPEQENYVSYRQLLLDCFVTRGITSATPASGSQSTADVSHR